jgi:hypothetical protein
VRRTTSEKEILGTINGEGMNRGLLFSKELVPYCGQVSGVHSRVTRIVDEKTAEC